MMNKEREVSSMHRIGVFSKLGRVTIKTLRYYDEAGLLTPAHRDIENGYRYYSTDQLFRLNKIVSLRQMGFSIQEISDIIGGRNVEMILQQRKKELESEQESVKNRLFHLESYMKEKQEDQFMNYQAVIKDIPGYTVFSAKRKIPNYATLNQIMPEIGMRIGKKNPDLKCIKPDYCFNVYLDGEYRDTDINVEVCQAVEKAGKDDEDIVFKELPSVKVVSVLHRGEYNNLGEAYAYGLKWLEQNNYKLVDNIRESYIDGIWNKENTDDWLTELQFPIEKN